MKLSHRVSLPVVTVVFASAAAIAQASPRVNEDKAQLKADQSALVREEERMEVDAGTLRADTRSGRMAAESKDAERVYTDHQAIQGQKRVIAADKWGSPQMKADRAALAREEKRMKADTRTLKADAREGKMAAESGDAEKVYQDGLAIRGEKKDIVADRARLRADGKV